MRKRFRIPFAILIVALLGGIVWKVIHPRDVLLRGKPEAEWIDSISYFGDQAQLKQWRELGPEGLQLLARRLDRGRHYRKFYRWIMPKIPGFLNRLAYSHMPNPSDTHESRMCVVALLSQLGKYAMPVEPAIARAVNDDDSGVRQSALGCYEELLEAMGEKEKAERLPAFLHALEDSDSGIRHNAAVALRFYRGQGQVVVPALVKTLQDPVVAVHLMAAKALAHIDAQTAIRSGVVAIAIQNMKDPTDQISAQAAKLLGQLGIDPVLAMSAFAESVKRGTASPSAQKR